MPQLQFLAVALGNRPVLGTSRAASKLRLDQHPLDQPARDLERLVSRGPGLSRI
jgi:hypothetical protein